VAGKFQRDDAAEGDAADDARGVQVEDRGEGLVIIRMGFGGKGCYPGRDDEMGEFYTLQGEYARVAVEAREKNQGELAG
jgi:hypothetical protein